MRESLRANSHAIKSVLSEFINKTSTYNRNMEANHADEAKGI